MRWGVGWGCVLAAGFSLYVSGVALLTGGAALNHARVHLLTVVGAYWAAGVAAGALIGVLRPVLDDWTGWALVGWIAGAVAYGAIGVAVDGLTTRVVPAALALGLLVGVPGAFLLRD